MSVYISSGTSYVSRGQVLDTPYVYRSGSVVVLSGGSVSAAFLSNGGTEIVSSGGVDWGADIVSGGQMTISIGGLTSLTSVYSSGSLVASGGRISNCILFDEGAKMYVGGVDLGSSIAKGIASDVSVRGGGSAIVRAYGVGSAVKVESGYLYVINRGYIENTTVGGSSGTAWAARTYIQDGGSAYRTTVSSNGIFVVSYGAHVSQTTVYSGGSVLVSSAGIVSGTTACGGVIHLLPTASALDTTLTQNAYAGGSMYISSGASATSTTIQNGQLTILNGGYTFGSNHLIDGVLWVESGARAFTFDVSSGAIYVSAGGSAVGLTMYGGALHMEADSSGGTAVASADLVSIMGNARANVKSGGSITDVTVVGSGLLDVDDGAFASGVEILSSGARMRVTRGYADSVVISSGGSVYAADGHLYDVTVKTSGSMTLLGSSYLSGGSIYGSVTVSSAASATALNVLLLGNLDVAGRATNCTVFSGGRVTVSKGGKLLGTYASTGGIFTVHTNGTAFISGTGISATISGGSMTVSSGQVRTASIDSGILNLRDGSYLSGGQISAGILSIVDGCSAGNVSVSGAGGETGSSLAQITVASGARTSSGDITGSYARLNVYDGAAAYNMTMASGGSAVVNGVIESCVVSSGGYIGLFSSGAQATNTTIGAGGSMVLTSRTVAVNTTLTSGSLVFSGGTANLVYVSQATLNMLTGSASSAFLRQGGSANVIGDATMSFTYIENGGELNVSDGGRNYSAYVSSGGTIKVLSGGYCYDTYLSSGAVAENYGGYFTGYFMSGAKVVNFAGSTFGYVSAGADLVFSGGRAQSLHLLESGRVRIAGCMDEAAISISSGGILDFDISNLSSAGSAALVGFEDVHEIGGDAVYTLTVNDAQANDTYRLASDATEFADTITVQNTAGTALGTLMLGQITEIGGIKYALNMDENNVLSVTIGAVGPVPPTSVARGDRDGNGVSDVMFVWTGNNYAHGYWMNGTSEWWSANSTGVSADWDNLGSYDMSGDGKADAVMFGNVEVDGAKGAYIGYYQDGDDANGWVNIGFLDNSANTDWKNAVGNLTGGTANSIVWYAPELYALGAWTDGTDRWVTLSNTFGGSEWTLVGCGDFDGDGKDSVVMAYNGGQLFYTANLDGATASLGSLNWSGWEVRAIGDFAGDGKDDIVLFHAESGSMVMLADGSADDYASIGQLDPVDWFVAGCGDYNGDGTDDLLVRQYSTGMLGYYSNGDTTQWNVLGYGVDMSWTVIA